MGSGSPPGLWLGLLSQLWANTASRTAEVKNRMGAVAFNLWFLLVAGITIKPQWSGGWFPFRAGALRRSGEILEGNWDIPSLPCLPEGTGMGKGRFYLIRIKFTRQVQSWHTVIPIKSMYLPSPHEPRPWIYTIYSWKSSSNPQVTAGSMLTYWLVKSIEWKAPWLANT